MSKQFLTNPESPPTKNLPTPGGDAYFEFKEGVAAELTNFGVPTRTAEVAVIDHRPQLIKMFHKHKNPERAAVLLYDSVVSIYGISS